MLARLSLAYKDATWIQRPRLAQPAWGEIPAMPAAMISGRWPPGWPRHKPVNDRAPSRLVFAPGSLA